MATAAPKPASLAIPERRSRTHKRRGVLLIINHEHVQRVLAYRAEMEGEAA